MTEYIILLKWLYRKCACVDILIFLQKYIILLNGMDMKALADEFSEFDPWMVCSDWLDGPSCKLTRGKC